MHQNTAQRKTITVQVTTVFHQPDNNGSSSVNHQIVPTRMVSVVVVALRNEETHHVKPVDGFQFLQDSVYACIHSTYRERLTNSALHSELDPELIMSQEINCLEYIMIAIFMGLFGLTSP
ncbi:hypothetical protein CBL_14420 [Carabus blaptoides fortunei]